MRMFKFLVVPITQFLFTPISHSSIPIYPDDNPDGWMHSKKQDGKSANPADTNKSTNFNLNISAEAKNADVAPHDQIINHVDAEIDKKLNSTDFSKEEITNLKDFMHNGIKSQSVESLTNSTELIIKNTETLIEKYKEQKKVCMANQGAGYMHESCFNAFVQSFCPHFPIC